MSKSTIDRFLVSLKALKNFLSRKSAARIILLVTGVIVQLHDQEIEENNRRVCKQTDFLVLPENDRRVVRLKKAGLFSPFTWQTRVNQY